MFEKKIKKIHENKKDFSFHFLAVEMILLLKHNYKDCVQHIGLGHL